MISWLAWLGTLVPLAFLLLNWENELGMEEGRDKRPSDMAGFFFERFLLLMLLRDVEESRRVQRSEKVSGCESNWGQQSETD